MKNGTCANEKFDGAQKFVLEFNVWKACVIKFKTLSTLCAQFFIFKFQNFFSIINFANQMKSLRLFRLEHQIFNMQLN